VTIIKTLNIFIDSLTYKEALQHLDINKKL